MPNLTTLATFPDPAQAALVRNLLQDEGIQAFLADEAMVSAARHLTGALAGVKLQVAEEDLPRAREVLEKLQSRPPAGWTDDEEEPLTLREQSAARALKAAVFGLAFCPLEFYAFWLLIYVAVSDERLAGRPRRYAVLALLICVPFMIALGFFLRAMFAR